LVDKLQKDQNMVHLVEDAETLLDDKKAFGVLRSALWSQSNARPMERPVTWGAMGTDISFTFTGGIIVISNVNLAEASPEIRAIKTRIKVLTIDVTQEEIKALMKKICIGGHEFGDLYLDPAECMEVRQRVIDRLAETKRNLDIRLMVNGFKDFLQWRNGDSKLHWHDLLEGRLSERTTAPAYKSKAIKTAEKTRLALEINAMPISWAEKCKKAGMSSSAFQRALKRAGATPK
jgi:hypothetical protein